MVREDNQFLVTTEGLAKLKKELKELTTQKRAQVAQRIQSARELGDITENSEYDAALEEQAFVEGKVSELEEVIKKAKIVKSVSGKPSEVNVGSKVKVHLEGQEQEFEIVSELEANPLKNRISHESPLGKALLGKKVGEKIEVEAPIGKIIYKILSIF